MNNRRRFSRDEAFWEALFGGEFHQDFDPRPLAPVVSLLDRRNRADSNSTGTSRKGNTGGK